MKVQEAMVMRIRELCKKRHLKISRLAYDAGMPESTLKNVMKGTSRNPGIVTIKKICDGLDISLNEFFNTDTFRDLEQEIE